MDVKELILLNSDKVRRDSNLMAFYIKSFMEAFGYKPNCAGCTFSSDWNKLVSFIKNDGKSLSLNLKSKVMENTFRLKKIQNKIFAYRIGKTTYRSYDNLFNDDFVKAFLKHGTEEEIIERKKLFSVLPKERAEDPENKISDEKVVKVRKKRITKQK